MSKWDAILMEPTRDDYFGIWNSQLLSHVSIEPAKEDKPIRNVRN